MSFSRHAAYGRPRQTDRSSFGPKTSWDHVSDWYATYLAQPGTFQHDLIFPGAARLLDAQPHKRYLDIACGQGAFIHWLLKQQLRATYHGLDASPSLIMQAKASFAYKQRASSPNGSGAPSFTVTDARRFATALPSTLTPFDGATCILALQNIDPFEDVLRETARVLAPGAPFVIVLNHPCFRAPRQSGWGWDEERKLQYRRVDRYLSTYEMPIRMHPGSAPSVKTYSYHRPVQTYMTALAQQGFVVDAFEEWVSPRSSDSGPRAKAENVARVEIPLFLAIRARRVDSI